MHGEKVATQVNQKEKEERGRGAQHDVEASDRQMFN